MEIPMDADEVLARLMAPGGRASAAEMVAFERVNVELSDDVFPKMVAGALRALRTPVPREVSFHPGRVIESTVGLEGGPGNWNIHQMHAVLPTRPGRARVLFRISPDLAWLCLPALVYHPMQIALGSALVPRLRSWASEGESAGKSAGESAGESTGKSQE